MTKRELLKKIWEEVKDFNNNLDNSSFTPSIYMCREICGTAIHPNESVKMIENIIKEHGENSKLSISMLCGVGDFLAATIIAGIADPKHCYGYVVNEYIAPFTRERLKKLGVPEENIKVVAKKISNQTMDLIGKHKLQLCVESPTNNSDIMTNKSLLNKLKEESFDFYDNLSENDSFEVDDYVTLFNYEFKKLSPLYDPTELMKVVEKLYKCGKKYKKFVFPNCGTGDLIAAAIISGVADPKNCYGVISEDFDGDIIAAIARKRLKKLGVPEENIISYDVDDNDDDEYDTGYPYEYPEENFDEEALIYPDNCVYSYNSLDYGII